MYFFIGGVVGCWLGYVAAGPVVVHWAVRLLSAVVALLLLLAGAVGGVLSWLAGDGSGGVFGFGVAALVGAVIGAAAGGASSLLAFAVRRGVISGVVSKRVSGGLVVVFLVVVFAWPRSDTSGVDVGVRGVGDGRLSAERAGGVAGVGAGLPVAGREEAGAVQGVQVETAARGDGQAACLCSAGASCVGPRGGVYCVSDAGSKRYLKGQ